MRRDIHNAIVPVDLYNPKDVSTVVETLQNVVRRNVPIRWGLVPYTGSTTAAQQARVAYHLLDAYGLGALMTYFEDVCTVFPMRLACEQKALHAPSGDVRLRCYESKVAEGPRIEVAARSFAR